MVNRRIPQYPCGVCNSNCKPGDWSVFCDSCQMWFHDHCEGISTSQMDILGGTDAAFLCTSCTHLDGVFDFGASITRLGIAAKEGISVLKIVVEVEEIHLRKFSFKFDLPPVSFGSNRIDSVAASMLQKMGGTMGMQPAVVRGDGNCLFNALSVCIYGDERATDQIRVLTAIDLLNFREDYTTKLTSRDIHLVSPDYDEACIACATSGQFSSAWTMQAAASVMKRKIVSTYPPMNGLFDGVYKILDTTFKPRDHSTLPPIHIMWTSASAKRCGTWTPNHFVPLLSSVSLLSDISVEHANHSSIVSVPHDEISVFSLSPIDDDNDPMFTYDRQETPDRSAEILQIPPRASTPNPLKRSYEEIVSSDPEDDPDRNSLPGGKFMTIVQILKVIQSKECRKTVPLGKKDNVFFILDNSANEDKWKVKSRGDFADDCGVWDSKKGSTVNSYIVLDCAGNPKTVTLKNNEFCVGSRVKGKLTWVPLVPQPSEETVVKLHRYYATLKAEDTFKKRITCVSGSTLPRVAVVEYSGTREKESVHGNAKSRKIYTRTDPVVMEKIGERVKDRAPRQVYQTMVEENSFEAPRDFKQVRDKKYNDEKRDRPQHRKNVADEVLNVIGMLNENPYVQQIIHNKGKAPCVILYSNDQMEDMKRNIASGSVLGVDRTFNLGACYVTTTVYKNCTVLHKESGESPLFLGPMYLHWDGEFKTYHSFFSHLQAELLDTVSNIDFRLGSDQELALVKAMKCCFPGATHILCSKHLRENVSRYLTDKVGCPTHERVLIVEKIFGEKGLLKSKDEYEYEENVVNLLPCIEKYPSFKLYFDKLKPLLYNYVFVPHVKGQAEKLWTNNNCESVNNILKLTLNWRPHKLPDLVEKICGVTKLQMIDLRRALYGTGNYVLVPKMKKYCVNREVWVNKSEEEKCKLFTDFLTRKKCTKVDKIHATNVQFSIPATNTIAKKPCQRKRSRSERAR